MSLCRHCHHCREGCQGCNPVTFGPARKHYDANWAEWRNGQCPACAEAKRIAAALVARADAVPGTSQEVDALLRQLAEAIDGGHL